MKPTESSDDSWEPTGYEGPPSRKQILARAFQNLDRRKSSQPRQPDTPSTRYDSVDDLLASQFESMWTEVQTKAKTLNPTAAIRLACYMCLTAVMTVGYVADQTTENRVKPASHDVQRALPEHGDMTATDRDDRGRLRSWESTVIDQ